MARLIGLLHVSGDFDFSSVLPGSVIPRSEHCCTEFKKRGMDIL
jgi:hypothetical protein